ncbi:MAG: ATP-binding cassette domain-containing protein [Lachnospiraceae bacterium]|nr:ATP-binding cassette domain-containing protein [Lachnospiraceae bacterium]
MEYIGAEDLTFSYNRDIVLSSAEFSLPKGAFAVVTGPSGVGKSTVLKLMLGVFKAKQGRVFLKCKEERISLDRSTRRLFAYVPQGNLLFSGTLKENLLVVKPDATEEDLQRAVYVSAMDEYLYQLPQGPDTTLGENSAGLSEGQSQRLAIARAILGDAPILLLDEATSALDAATEELVLERIRSLPGKTCIAVTHRPAAVSLADWEIRIQGHKLQCIHHAGIDIEG